MKVFFTVFASLSFTFIFKANAQHVISDCPASPYAIEIIQPDGTKINIMGKGSMKNSWTETLEGYSVVKNKDGIYEYAQENNGQLFPSGFLVVENIQNLDKQNFLDKQVKHLRPAITKQESLNSNNMRLSDRDDLKFELSFPKAGTRKVLVLLIDYPD